MNRDEIEERVRTMLTDLFKLKSTDIRLDSRLFEDLGLDSIDAIDMVVQLQELTGRRVEEAALRSVRTVADVVRVVEEHLTPET